MACDVGQTALRKDHNGMEFYNICKMSNTRDIFSLIDNFNDFKISLVMHEENVVVNKMSMVGVTLKDQGREDIIKQANIELERELIIVETLLERQRVDREKVVDMI